MLVSTSRTSRPACRVQPCCAANPSQATAAQGFSWRGLCAMSSWIARQSTSGQDDHWPWKTSIHCGVLCRCGTATGQPARSSDAGLTHYAIPSKASRSRIHRNCQGDEFRPTCRWRGARALVIASLAPGDPHVVTVLNPSPMSDCCSCRSRCCLKSTSGTALR